MFTRSALTTATLVAAIAVSAPAATAREAGTAANRSPQTSAGTTSPYAEPLAALGGRTLAQYLSDHMEHRLARL